MVFAQLPPEINSALMYSGPGSGSMLAAAAAWEELAAELYATASAYGSLIAGLTAGPWQGPAAASMLVSATRQVVWLRNTALRAEEAAVQAVAAASAYEAAFSGTVPPPEIAANRALLQVLLATNVLGRNVAAIAATEALYAEMWEQDAVTMYSYASAAAAASTLTPFTVVAVTTNPAGLAGEAAAVTQVLGENASMQGLYVVAKALSSLVGSGRVPPGLANLMAAFGGFEWNSNGGLTVGGVLGDLLKGLTGSRTLDASTAFDAIIRWISPTRLFTTSFKDIQAIVDGFATDASKAAGAATKAVEAVPHAIPLSGGGLGGVAGALGKATSVGRLSTPPAWIGAVPAVNPAIVTVKGLEAAAAIEPATNTLGGLPVMGAGGGRGLTAHFAAPRYGFKPTVIVRPPAGG